jgi:hypothetical protein
MLRGASNTNGAVVRKTTKAKRNRAVKKRPTTPPAKNRAAVTLGKLGGRKGGLTRAANLTARERSTIAKKAAEARWGNKSKP